VTRAGAGVLVALALAAGLALRTARLAERPMHHDEANQAVKFGALLERGAKVDAREPEFQQTALMIAVREDHDEAVGVLLAAGASPNAQTRKGPIPAFVLPCKGTGNDKVIAESQELKAVVLNVVRRLYKWILAGAADHFV